jgi:predicted transposase YdaD
MMLRPLQKGLSMEQVSEILELDVETVKQAAQQQP